MINLGTPIIPQATSADLHGIAALLAFLADKDACARRLAELTEATKKHDEARAATVAERAGVETATRTSEAAEAKIRMAAEAKIAPFRTLPRRTDVA